MQTLEMDSSIRASTFSGPSSQKSERSACITEEFGWRVPPGKANSADAITIARWNGLAGASLECSSETPPDCHVIGVTLRNMHLRLAMNGRSIHEGRLVTGSFHVTPPQGRLKCTFRGAYDAMHLFVPNRIIEKKAQEILGHRTTVWSDCPQQDPAIAHLARSLVLSAQEGCRDLRDQIAMAIVTRLLISTRRPAGDTAHDGGGLPRWRLQRVTDYIEANLDQPLSLAEIAAVSGLSRMHFAAQFRKSTGQRPHQYVLDRRVERAQEMLAGTNLPIVQVALSVGFQAQSHFTTIFKRAVGQPPHAWRRDQAVPARRSQ